MSWSARVRLRRRTLVYLVSGIAAVGFAVYRLAGPQGIRLLVETHRELQEFQRSNAEMERALAEWEVRVRNLEENPAEVESEIRKQLRLQKKKETTFLLPETKK
ncbi:MAG: septum formation initiator family protein [Bryobacteraceae bacterium]|nr:septum formation initiator family protein [Bryobacteraceae bacterium]